MMMKRIIGANLLDNLFEAIFAVLSAGELDCGPDEVFVRRDDIESLDLSL